MLLYVFTHQGMTSANTTKGHLGSSNNILGTLANLRAIGWRAFLILTFEHATYLPTLVLKVQQILGGGGSCSFLVGSHQHPLQQGTRNELNGLLFSA